MLQPSSDNKRVLNKMRGFKKGLEVFAHVKTELEGENQDFDENVAFALGVLAGVYNSVEDQQKLWEIRKKGDWCELLRF